MSRRAPLPSKKNILSFLKSTDIFGQFSDAILQDLLADREWLSLRKGEILFQQGDPGGFFCLVYTGCLGVTASKKDSPEITLATIGPGMVVGEIQILSGGSRTASVAALKDANLIKFSKPAFDRLANSAPEVLQKFAEIIRTRLRCNQLTELLPVFCGPVDLAMLATIQSEIEWVHLPSGVPLFHQGDSGSDFFLLINGRLQVSVRGHAGVERNVAEIKRGTIVGEMAMFTGDKRTASIYAIRDSALVKFSRQAFERIIAAHPNIMMHFIQFIIKRMKEISTVSHQDNKTLNIAIVSANPDTPLTEFSIRLVAALSAFGKTLHLSSKLVDRHWGIPGMAQATGADPNNIRLSAWLDEQEATFTNIVYEADRSATAWTKQCLQHADRVMLVAQSGSDPRPAGMETALCALDRCVSRAHRILVLLHPDGTKLPSNTSQWLAERQVDSHYHVRWNTNADVDRLARFLTGNAIGLVLGGGGARGLAHIGVIRALNEANVPIDVIGGTSMGAMISAQYAVGMDYQTMLDVQKKVTALKPLREFTLPFVSLTKSKRLEKIVNKLSGDTHIEDLWVNFFCISSNLTSAEMVVHRKGLLGKSIRASGALPVIMKPVLEKNSLLVDGALFNNVPADIMKEICGGIVIMVNVSPNEDLKMPDQYKEIPGDLEILWSRLNPFKQRIAIPGILDIMMRTIMVGSANKENQTRKAADYVFRPPVDRFGLLEFEAIDEIVDAGYRYAKEKVRELQKDGLLGG